MSVLKNLISHYDFISWIPTLRGRLSIDLIDDAKGIIGDVDKYLVRFKKINGFRSEHFIIASSLHTVISGRKLGKEYLRSFRYIFTGSINNEIITKDFLEKYDFSKEKKLKQYMDKEGLFMGHLIIVAEVAHTLSDLEVSFLRKLIDLDKINKVFNNNFYVNVASVGELNEISSNMFLLWEELHGIASQIENDDNNKRPIFSFDVILTRDGILLLKDTTSSENKAYYAASGTEEDYKKNIHIHPLFIVAMEYVKYLFLSTDYHKEYIDIYLPPSNLYAAKASGSLDLKKVFEHLLDALLVQVIKLKQYKYLGNIIKPEVILLYAKSFIKVFESNNLVEQSVTSKASFFCDNLLKEIELMSRKPKIIAKFSPDNKFGEISSILTFVLTCLTLYKIFVDIEPMKFFDPNKIIEDIGLVMVLVIIAYTLYLIPRSRDRSKQRKPKLRNKSIFFVNSNLKRARFSRFYDIYIGLFSSKAYINSRSILLHLQVIFWMVMMIISFTIMLYIIF